MVEAVNTSTGSVEPFPAVGQTSIVSDELNRILTLLREACPTDAHITFEFDGRLQVHIDVRKREDVTMVETLIPRVGLGLFQNISRGGTPHHPFYHRISALVAR